MVLGTLTKERCRISKKFLKIFKEKEVNPKEMLLIKYIIILLKKVNNKI